MITLLPHQEKGVKFISLREPSPSSKIKTFGAILADEMGLGKTIQTIALISSSPLKTTLLCCPSTLCEMWKSQFKRFAPDVNTYMFRTKNTLDQIFTIINKADETSKHVIICSYGITFRRPELTDFKYDRIVCDEAHVFRNSKGKVFNALIKLQAKTKLVLTGTPIQNKIGDIVTLINFIIGMKLKLDIDFVKMFIKDRMIRRRMEDVGIVMPKLEIKNIDIESKTNNKQALTLTSEFNYNHHLEKIIRRKQASVFPQVLNKSFCKAYELPAFNVNNEKANTIINAIVKNDTNCIVFTEFTDELNYIKQSLQTKLPNKKIESISGSTPISNRDTIANDTSINILVIQINTAGVGLNLQHFNVVHFTNIQWNPSNTDQAIGRINRIGQKENMTVFIYSFKNSIDERISYIAKKKRCLISEFIS
tara:strand:- start:432 stop:1697 length:1266 start_codon:yes stop_codon:yes gene_type:complete